MKKIRKKKLHGRKRAGSENREEPKGIKGAQGKQPSSLLLWISAPEEGRQTAETLRNADHIKATSLIF